MEHDGSLYTVYLGVRHGKELGIGGQGTVKLVQNDLTNKWHVIKVFKTKNDAKVVEEHKALLELEVGHGTVISKELAEDEKKQFFVMDYARGKNLFRFLESEPSLSAMQWLDIALKTAYYVQSIHEKGYLHCDIKLDNILYDLLTGRIVLVDLGIAAKMDKYGQVLKWKRGTYGYMPPEINQRGVVTFSTASDIYSLGKTFEEIFGISKITKTDGSSIQTNSPFRNDKELKNLLRRMTAVEPTMRPTLPEVIAKLEELRKDLLPLSVKATAIVHVRDYEGNKKAYISALKSADKVILVDDMDNENKQDMLLPTTDTEYYNKVSRQLEENGIAVIKKAIVFQQAEDLMDKIRELDAKDEEGTVISQICYFHPASNPAISKVPAGVQTVKIKKLNTNYRKEILNMNVLVPDEQVANINIVFNAELSRLQKKKKDSKAQARALLLPKAIEDINKEHALNQLTFFTLYEKLTALENSIINIKSTSCCSFTLIKPKTARVVKKLKKDVKWVLPKMKS